MYFTDRGITLEAEQEKQAQSPGSIYHPVLGPQLGDILRDETGSVKLPGCSSRSSDSYAS